MIRKYIFDWKERRFTTPEERIVTAKDLEDLLATLAEIVNTNKDDCPGFWANAKKVEF